MWASMFSDNKSQMLSSFNFIVNIDERGRFVDF